MSAATKKHIVLVPFPAFGHIIPMMELAKKLSIRHHVTFIVPPNKLQEIEKRDLFDPEHDDVQLLALDDGVTVDYDTDLDPKQFAEAMQQMMPVHYNFFSAIPCKNNPTSSLLKSPVDAVISDMGLIMIIKAVHSLGIPAYMFSCAAAWNMKGVLKVDENTPTCSDESFFNGENEAANNFDVIMESWKDLAVAFHGALPCTKAVLINSFYELEPTVKQEWEQSPKTVGVPLKFLGPLFPTDNEKKSEKVTTQNQVQKWLDAQKDSSVVYLSFGSMARPVPDQIKEIASGLLALNKPFIWSLRSNLHQHLPEQIQIVIAEQLITPDLPFLILPWAPQKTILAHIATKVFVSHCGWNSTLEGISHGIPFVAWPMFADQHLNADFLVKLGIGIRIPKTGLKAVRIIPGTELAQAVTTVAGWGEGDTDSSYFDKAQEMGRKAVNTVAEGGTTYNDFVELLNL